MKLCRKIMIIYDESVFYNFLLQTLYCYWPSINAARKARKLAIPDKINWGKFKIRVLSQTGKNDLL